jgi:hypothetical protein
MLIFKLKEDIMQPKSERLKKLETELHDLEQWLKLGLVPKKDLEKHQNEIASLKEKVKEEHERLQGLKESGEVEEYSIPKRSSKSGYQEQGPDVEIGSDDGFTDIGFDLESETYESTQATSATEAMYTVDEEAEEDDDEDPFSDKNRWKRGMLDEQDTSQW